MKIAVHIIRSLLGALFLWGGIAYFFKLGPQEMPAQPILDYMKGINLTHTMTIVKSIELFCGILLITNQFAPLANVILFPISINILLVHTFLDQKTLPVAIVIIALHLFLAYAYRKNYAGLFSKDVIA